MQSSALLSSLASRWHLRLELKIGGWDLLIFELTLKQTKKKERKERKRKKDFSGNCIEGHSSRRAKLH